MSGRRRVVVTGMGIVSPAGSGRAPFWENLLSGRSFVRPIDRFDASSYPTQIAAAADERGIPDELQHYDRISRFAIAAADDALADAKLSSGSTPFSPRRRGVVMATGMGTYGHREIFAACSNGASNDGFDWDAFHALARAHRETRAAERRTPGSVPAIVARRAGFRGPVMSVMTACAAGSQALGDAARWIRGGQADVVLAGGADSELYPMGLASFCLLRALSRRNDDAAQASRPFSQGRDGFVIGEGAAALVLEELHHALDRGAHIYAELAGFGSASDAWRVTDPHPEGDGAVRAMTQALRDGQASADEVGYINAHGTSTVANDRIETTALKRVFGTRAPRIPVSSTKSMIGHLTVAAGAAEAVATVMSLAEQKVHPTINYTDPDPECDLDYVPNVARNVSLDYALSNSFAFGGQCASVLFARFAEAGRS
jgi:3-oxoacyl-[acyl-carrier-protein] synthase II